MGWVRPGARLLVACVSCVCICGGFGRAAAVEFNDHLLGTALPAGLSPQLSPGSKGSIAPTPNGVLISNEATRYAFLKLENSAPGSDRNPLRVSTRIRTAPGNEAGNLPGLYVYWDSKNYAFVRVTSDQYVYAGTVKDGVEHSQAQGEVMRDTKIEPKLFSGKETFVQIVVVDRNIAFFYSQDGAAWQKIVESGRRPGAIGAAPVILCGRGIAGEKPLLANDVNQDARPLIKTYVSELVALDHPIEKAPLELDIPKKETWEKTLESLEASGTPSSWAFLAPAPERAYGDPKDWIAEENWNSIKNIQGKAVKYTLWNRPEEDTEDTPIDLRDTVEFVKNSTVLGRTGLQWPVDGPALLWFDCNEPIRMWVNNVPVFTAEGRDWWADRRTLKDRRAVPVVLKQGLNTLKIAIRQQRGDTSFHLRLERNDSAYRLALLSKMSALFPPAESGARARIAVLEIAQLRENVFDFDGALAAYSRALNEFGADEEARVRALEGLFRIQNFLHDYDATVKTADAFLARFPNTEGSLSAENAALRAEALAGRLDAARQRIQRWSAGNDGAARELELSRQLAAALMESGGHAGHLAALESIAANTRMPQDARADATAEAAIWRWEYELADSATTGKPKPAIAEQVVRGLTGACELLQGGKDPQVRELLKEALADLKDPKIERAVASAWGALLLAKLGSNPASRHYFTLANTYDLALPLKDEKNAPITDMNQFKEQAWKVLREKAGDLPWASKWRIVTFKRNVSAVRNANDLPENNPDPGAHYAGRGWAEIEPEADKTERNEFGFDVRRFSGDGQIVYLSRDFDAKQALDTLLQLSNAGAWTAWLDGKLLGRDLLNDDYRIEADRLPLKLSQGRHRLLVRLELPADGPVFFRARVGSEPQLGLLALLTVLQARQSPGSLPERLNDFNVLRQGLEERVSGEAMLRYAQAVALLYDSQRWIPPDLYNWVAYHLQIMKEDLLAASALRDALRMLESGARENGRMETLMNLARAVARTRVTQGDLAAADALLRDYSERYPVPARNAAASWAWRGQIRRELGLSEAALPFFERCTREGHMGDDVRMIVQNGIDWARNSHPERVGFESSRDVQATLDGVRRQFAGTPEDAVKAAHTLNEVLRGAPAALINVEESKYAARYVGAREYARALLAGLPENMREVYRKVVGEAAELKLRAVPASDPYALERAALDYPFTSQARAALTRAGDLYLDRAQFGPAISLFEALLADVSAPAESASLRAKLAVALQRNGQPALAAANLKALTDEFADVVVTFKGEASKGRDLASKIAAAHPPQTEPHAADTSYMGGLARTGALNGPAPKPGVIAWAQPLISSSVLNDARGRFGADAPAHLQSHPVSDGTRVFVAALESLRAIDALSGKILWTRIWGTPGSATAAFGGFPSCVPALAAGKIVSRAQGGASCLKCFETDTGELRWSSDAKAETRRFTWISDPAIAYGTVYAVFAEVGDFSTHGVAALDLETGRLRWSTRLVNGNPGIKVNDAAWQTSFHMGPPAIDGGDIYVNTGLASVAALNAFTGEPRWASRYAPLQLGDLRHGFDSTFDMTLHSFKVFSRGPLPPMVSGELIVVAPQDFGGVMAFHRRDGSLAWSRALADCRYVAGIVDGKIIACDDSLTALDVRTGALDWRTHSDEVLFGCPELSGGVLYYPARSAFLRIDPRTGKTLTATPWASSTGPCANPLVLADRIVAVNETSVVAFLDADAPHPSGATAIALALNEARKLEREGKLEEASAAYAQVLQGEDHLLPRALASRVRLLAALGKKDEARAAIAKLEKEAPEALVADGGLWLARRSALVAALKRELGEPPAPKSASIAGADAQRLGGVLCYSHFYPGENPALAHFPDDSENRMYVRLDGTVTCVEIADSPQVIWSAYIGAQVRQLIAGGAFVAAVGDREIDVLDRDSGETLSHIVLSSESSAAANPKLARRWRASGGENIQNACLSGSAVFMSTAMRFDAWDARSGKLLWSRSLRDEVPLPASISTHGEAVVRIYQHRDEYYITEYDAATGTETKTLPIQRQQRFAFSKDRRYLVARMDNTFTAVDLHTLTVLWRKGEPDFDLASSTIEFTPDGQIRYAGPNKQDGNKHTVRYLDALTGNDTAPAMVDANGSRADNDLFVMRDNGYRIARLRVVNGNTEPVWTQNLPYRNGVHESFTRSLRAGPLIHSIGMRTFDDGSHEQLSLRSFSWDSGRRVSEQVLPGTPILETNPYTGQRVLASRVTSVGGSLVYTAKEGVFVFRSFGETPAKAAEKIRHELRAPETTPQARTQLRRGLAGLEPQETMAFLAPEDVRVDGGLGEWRGTEPLLLADRSNYCAGAGISSGESDLLDAVRTPEWGGPADLSARIYTGWNSAGLTIAVDVTDDIAVASKPGRETTSGDRVRIVLDAYEGPHAAPEPGATFVATLALVDGAAVFTPEFEASAEAGAQPQGRVSASPSGNGRQYEFFVPWAILRKNSWERPGDKREMGLGVAIYDDDGAGTKGALEWGAGITMPGTMPLWLGRLSLIDVSTEKIERYRTVIQWAPDSPEALKFLRLIMLSKRGENAPAERIDELEKFVRAHPASSNTPKALSLLRGLYRAAGENDPDARLERLSAGAKVGAPVKEALNTAFDMWVYPDPKNPPKTILFQFSNGDWTYGTHRAYWGAPLTAWGREGTLQMKYMGEIPPPGKWTQLTVRALDFDLEDMYLKAFALTHSGGTAFYSRATSFFEGTRKTLLDGELPPHWVTQHGQLNWVDQPNHDGKKALALVTAEQNDGIYNIHFGLDTGLPILSFAAARPEAAEKNPERLADIYRKSALLINDTPDGLALLRRAIDLTPGDEKVRCEKALVEIRSFLKTSAGSSTPPNAFEALKLAYDYIARSGDPDPMKRCEALITEAKIPWSATRPFYAEHAPALTRWNVLGPFAAMGERRGMEVALDPERGVDLKAKTQVPGRELVWKPFAPDKASDFVDLRAATAGGDKAVYWAPYFVYAYTKFSCPSKRKVLFAYGADDVVSIWVNGKRVVAEQYTTPQKDKEHLEVQLRSGENEILIKTGVQRERAGFYFRICDMDGKPFDDLPN